MKIRLLLTLAGFAIGFVLPTSAQQRSSDNLVGSWIEIESSTEEEDSDAEVLE